MIFFRRNRTEFVRTCSSVFKELNRNDLTFETNPNVKYLIYLLPSYIFVFSCLTFDISGNKMTSGFWKMWSVLPLVRMSSVSVRTEIPSHAPLILLKKSSTLCINTIRFKAYRWRNVSTKKKPSRKIYPASLIHLRSPFMNHKYCTVSVTVKSGVTHEAECARGYAVS